MIFILAYDDNKARLEGIELLINHTPDMHCLGAFEDCNKIVQQVINLKPDIVLMDIDMPKINGIEALKLIKKNTPDVAVIMQTVFDDDDKIFAALQAGASGYYLKKTAPEKLIEGIREVAQGGAYMTPSIAMKVLTIFQNIDKNTPQKIKNNFNLTEREIEILSLLVEGLNYKAIAERYGISWHTVNAHTKKIYEKLHVHSAQEAVAKAVKQNII